MPGASGTRRCAWIVGATSFFGRYVARALSARGYDVCGVSRRVLDDGSLWGVTEVEIGAVTPQVLNSALRRFGAPDVVVHCVGSGSVGAASADPVADRERTVESVVTLTSFLRAERIAARLLYPSSAAVYGSACARPIGENAPLSPISVYGQNKLAAEEVCRQTAGLDVVVLRLFSVYGRPQRKLLLWDLGRRLLSGCDTLVLSGTGEETRDFIHATDAAAAVALLADADNPPKIVNIGTGRPTKIMDIAAAYAKALKVSASISFNNVTRPGDPTHLCADTTTLNKLGFSSSIDLKSGLENYADWLCIHGLE